MPFSPACATSKRRLGWKIRGHFLAYIVCSKLGTHPRFKHLTRHKGGKTQKSNNDIAANPIFCGEDKADEGGKSKQIADSTQASQGKRPIGMRRAKE